MSNHGNNNQSHPNSNNPSNNASYNSNNGHGNSDGSFSKMPQQSQNLRRGSHDLTGNNSQFMSANGQSQYMGNGKKNPSLFSSMYGDVSGRNIDTGSMTSRPGQSFTGSNSPGPGIAPRRNNVRGQNNRPVPVSQFKKPSTMDVKKGEADKKFKIF